MRFPQLLVCDKDSALMRCLAPTCRQRGWSLKEVRAPESCLQHISAGRAAVIVLRLGRDLVRELKLLERIGRTRPNVATIAVADSEDSALEAVLWTLGAAYVFMPPQGRDGLPDLVVGLMNKVLGKGDALPHSRSEAHDAKDR